MIFFMFSSDILIRIVNFETPSISEGEYKVELNTDKISGFTKIGYLFPNDDFKSLALQLSGLHNNQTALFGIKEYIGKQTSGYANIIFQQKILDIAIIWMIQSVISKCIGTCCSI